MNTYTIKGKFTTVNDLANELGEHRQQIVRWLKRYSLPHKPITCDKKVVVTLVPLDTVPAIRALSNRDTTA